MDAELSEGGEWGDSSGSEDDSSSSEDESTTAQEDSSTQQGDSVSFAPASTVFSSCDTADGNSSSSDSDGSSDTDSSDSGSSSSEDASEAGLFGDPSLSIPPNLPVPLRRNKRRKDGGKVCVSWLQMVFQPAGPRLAALMRLAQLETALSLWPVYMSTDSRAPH